MNAKMATGKHECQPSKPSLVTQELGRCDHYWMGSKIIRAILHGTSLASPG
jgi:hypothetical protein